MQREVLLDFASPAGHWRRLSLEPPGNGLLRVVELAEVMRGFGGVFVDPPIPWTPATNKKMQALWDRSRSVAPALQPGERLPIDYFISHSWADRRVNKTLTLALYFNCVTTCVVSMLVCVCGCALILNGGWQLPGAVVFCATSTAQIGTLFWWRVPLLWWDRATKWVRRRRAVYAVGNAALGGGGGTGTDAGKDFARPSPPARDLVPACPPSGRRGTGHRRRLYRGPTLFVDRLCVHQTNHHLRSEAIEGLAGILAQSDRVLAVWTPHYFDRLWCTFELAVFLAINPSVSKLDLIPNGVGVIFTWVTVVCNVSQVVWLMLIDSEGQANSDNPWVRMLILKVLSLFAYCLVVHTMRATMDQVEEQKRSAHRFSIHNTKCAVELDRGVLYNTIEHLFSNRYPAPAGKDKDGKAEFLPWDVAFNNVIHYRAVRACRVLRYFTYRHMLPFGSMVMCRYMCYIADFFAERAETTSSLVMALLQTATFSYAFIPIAGLYVGWYGDVVSRRNLGCWWTDLLGGVGVSLLMNLGLVLVVVPPALFGNPDVGWYSVGQKQGFMESFRITRGAVEWCARLALMLVQMVFCYWVFEKRRQHVEADEPDHPTLIDRFEAEWGYRESGLPTQYTAGTKPEG